MYHERLGAQAAIERAKARLHEPYERFRKFEELKKKYSIHVFSSPKLYSSATSKAFLNIIPLVTFNRILKHMLVAVTATFPMRFGRTARGAQSV